MAALVVAPTFDPTLLKEILKENLPAYARPMFLRLKPEMEITIKLKRPQGQYSIYDDHSDAGKAENKKEEKEEKKDDGSPNQPPAQQPPDQKPQ